jgi:XTP/dITP diphosphohydrolase
LANNIRIVLASSNTGKIRELSTLFSSLPIELIPQSVFDVVDVEETGLTFVENALLKARHAAKISGLPAIADDSGLAVDALQGAPGIYSARYAGIGVPNEMHLHKLLHALENTPDDQRQACFHCVLVFVTHENDPTPLICHGRWQGEVLRALRGTNGFGYDPVFYVPTEKKSAAELSPEQKNKISHRSMALQSLLTLLPEKLCTLSLSNN